MCSHAGSALLVPVSESPRVIHGMSVYWFGCETDVLVDSDMHCPKMAVTLGFGWLLVLG